MSARSSQRPRKANLRKETASKQEELNDAGIGDGGSHVGDICIPPASPPKHSADVGLESVGSVEVLGEFIIFCNGVGNDQKSALESAKELSNALNNRKVLLFYNPTTMQQCRDFLSNFHGETDLSLTLSEKILILINTCKTQGIKHENICVVIFAHSHGTVVVEGALVSLNMLDQTAKQHIHVYACGGVTLIPPKLANKVQNYFLEEDYIAEVGKTERWKVNNTYLIKRVKREGSNIGPLDPDFQKECDSVIILKGPDFNPKGEPVLNSANPFLAIARNCWNFLLEMAKNTYENHTFSTYLRLIRPNLNLRSL